MLAAQGSGTMKAPSFEALLYAALPFIAMCLTVPVWDRVYPMVVGLPFNLFWLILWTLLTPVCLWRAYRIEAARVEKSSTSQSGDGVS
jgi:hypothetical protein